MLYQADELGLKSDTPRFSRLHNLHPWYWNSLYSLISGENSAFVHFAADVANHYNLAFLFHQVPITAGWTEVVKYDACTNPEGPTLCEPECVTGQGCNKNIPHHEHTTHKYPNQTEGPRADMLVIADDHFNLPTRFLWVCMG